MIFHSDRNLAQQGQKFPCLGKRGRSHPGDLYAEGREHEGGV